MINEPTGEWRQIFPVVTTHLKFFFEDPKYCPSKKAYTKLFEIANFVKWWEKIMRGARCLGGLEGRRLRTLSGII